MTDVIVVPTETQSWAADQARVGRAAFEASGNLIHLGYALAMDRIASAKNKPVGREPRLHLIAVDQLEAAEDEAA